MKNKRVIFIDVKNGVIKERKVSTLKDCQALVGGRIERTLILENGDELYVNEEGLLGNPRGAFLLGNQLVVGNGYLIGKVTPTGDNKSALSTVKNVKNLVQFVRVGEEGVGGDE